MNEFERKIYTLLKKEGFVYRFPDSAILIKKTYRRINPPCDFLFLKNGRCYFIETKSVNADRFPMKNITQNQLKFAKKISDNGGNYVFLIEIIDQRFLIPYTDLLNLNKKNLHIRDFQKWKFNRESL